QVLVVFSRHTRLLFLEMMNKALFPLFRAPSEHARNAKRVLQPASLTAIGGHGRIMSAETRNMFGRTARRRGRHEQEYDLSAGSGDRRAGFCLLQQCERR